MRPEMRAWPRGVAWGGSGAKRAANAAGPLLRQKWGGARAPAHCTGARAPQCCSFACFRQRHEAASNQRCGQLEVALRQFEIGYQDYFSALKGEPQQGLCLRLRQIKQRKSHAHADQGRMGGGSQCLHIRIERGLRAGIRPRHPPCQRRLGKKCGAGRQSIKAGYRRGRFRRYIGGWHHCAFSRICSRMSRASACGTLSGIQRSRFCAWPSSINLRRLEAKCRSKNHVPSSRRKSLTQRRST